MKKPKRQGSDFSEEVEAHVRIEADRYRAQGLDEDAALAAARRAFGNLTQSRERYYESRRWLWWDWLRQDMRIALRLLAKTPGWTAVAALTVALGIGATAAMFGVVNTVLLRPLPFPHPENLYAFTEGTRLADSVLGNEYTSMRESSTPASVFPEMGAYDSGGVNWTRGDGAERLTAGEVTASFFSTLQVQPLYGRTFLPEEDKPEANPAVILSYSFWRQRFGGDPAIVGQTLRLDRKSATIVGIMPRWFDFPQGSEVWLPLALNEAEQRAGRTRIFEMIARANPSATPAQLDQELERLTAVVVDDFPACCRAPEVLKNIRMAAQPLQQRLTGNMRPALLMFSGAVALMLLIVCFTVANLMLARATARRREIAVRVALGSPRRRIVSQLLTESLILSLAGGGLGLGLAALAIQALNAVRQTALAGLPEVAIDASTAAFALIVTMLTGAAFGLAPALGSLGFGVRDALQGESRSASSGTGLRRTRQTLVIAQLGLSLTLAIGAGLLAKSFYRLRTMDPGFNAANVLTARVNLAGANYAAAQRQHQFMENLVQRASRLPGVETASIGPTPPGISGNLGRFVIEGQPDAAPGQEPMCGQMDVTLDYFQTLEVPLLQGRGLAARDSAEAPLVVVVNQALARKYFPGENPLGRHIRSLGWVGQGWAEIVGVVGDIHQLGLDQDVMPTLYRPVEQDPSPFMTRSNLLIRVANDPEALIPALERTVAGMDRDQPAFDAKSLERRLADSLGSRRFDASLTGAFALMAVFLASIGVYGVMSYLVTLRTTEIGIRLALGAQRTQVVALILREGVVLAAIGVALGIGGALALSRYLATLLYGVGSRDAGTIAAAVLAVLAAVFTACYVPGRRAARVGAAVALRHI